MWFFRCAPYLFNFQWYLTLLCIFEVPDLETPNFKVLRRNDQYEIREVEVLYLLSNFALNNLDLRLIITPLA